MANTFFTEDQGVRAAPQATNTFFGPPETPTAPRKRGTLERIARLLGTDERFMVGGLKATGAFADKKVDLFEILRLAATHPAEFARGGVAGERGEEDWQTMSRQMNPELPGWQNAIAGFTRGTAYTPSSYLGVGILGRILKMGLGAERYGRAGAAVGRAARAIPGVRHIPFVKGTEVEARGTRAIGEQIGVPLGTRAHGAPKTVGGKRVLPTEALTSYTQAGTEDVMSDVYRTAGAPRGLLLTPSDVAESGVAYVPPTVKRARLLRDATRMLLRRASRSEKRAAIAHEKRGLSMTPEAVPTGRQVLEARGATHWEWTPEYGVAPNVGGPLTSAEHQLLGRGRATGEAYRAVREELVPAVGRARSAVKVAEDRLKNAQVRVGTARQRGKSVLGAEAEVARARKNLLKKQQALADLENPPQVTPPTPRAVLSAQAAAGATRTAAEAARARVRGMAPETAPLGQVLKEWWQRHLGMSPSPQVQGYRSGVLAEAERAATRLERLNEQVARHADTIRTATDAREVRAAREARAVLEREQKKLQATLGRLGKKAQNLELGGVRSRELRDLRYGGIELKHLESARRDREMAAEYLRRAQAIGLREAYIVGTRPKRFTNKVAQTINNIAQRRSIPEAHAAAQGYVDATIERLRKLPSYGEDVATETKQFFTDLQQRATTRAQELAEAGILPESDMEKWGPFHVRRFFARYVWPAEEIAKMREMGVDPDLIATIERQSETGRAWSAGQQGIPSGIFEKRQLLTRSARQTAGKAGELSLGELPLSQKIVLGERLHAASISEAHRLAAYAKQYGRESLEAYRGVPAVATKDLAKWMMVPDTARWGALKAGTHIPKWLGAHLGLSGVGSGWEGTIARLASWALPARPSEAINWYTRELLGRWKFLHTAGNLPTQLRNMVTNGALTYLVGKIDAKDLPRAWARGFMAVARNTDEFKQALKLHPGFSSTWSSSELSLLRKIAGEMEDPGTAMGRALNAIAKGPGKAEHIMSRTYELSEQVAKMSVYLHWVEKGLAPRAAANLAMKAIFDYGDVSRVLNWLRRYGMAPFITFPAKAAVGLGQGILEQPGKFTALNRAIRGVGYANADDEATMAAERQYMTPEQRGSLMRLPIKTKEGETRYAEVGYYLPWGPFEKGVGFSWLDTMPVARVIEDIARNSSSFTGRQIYNPDIPQDKWPAISLYLKDWIGPRWIMTGIGRVGAAIAGKPVQRGFAGPAAADVPWTAAQEIGGLRTQGISPKPLKSRQKVAFRKTEESLRGDLVKQKLARKAGTITPEEYERRKKLIRDLIQKKLRETVRQPPG